MEDRRRRDVAFENLAKEMLRYLENSKDVKVCITELQEQLGGTCTNWYTLQQVAQLARNEMKKMGQKVFEIFWCAVERFGGVGKKVSGRKSGNTNAEQKTRNM